MKYLVTTAVVIMFAAVMCIDCGGRVWVAECPDAGVVCKLHDKLVCCPSYTVCGPLPATGCPADYCCPVPDNETSTQSTPWGPPDNSNYGSFWGTNGYDEPGYLPGQHGTVPRANQMPEPGQ